MKRMSTRFLFKVSIDLFSKFDLPQQLITGNSAAEVWCGNNYKTLIYDVNNYDVIKLINKNTYDNHIRIFCNNQNTIMILISGKGDKQGDTYKGGFFDGQVSFVQQAHVFFAREFFN